MQSKVCPFSVLMKLAVLFSKSTALHLLLNSIFTFSSASTSSIRSAVSSSLDIEFMYSSSRPLYLESFVLPSLSCNIRPCIGIQSFMTLSSKPTIFMALMPLLEKAKLIERPALISTFLRSGLSSITRTLYPLCPSRNAKSEPHSPAPIIKIVSFCFI